MRKALKDELASHSTFTVNDGNDMIIDNAHYYTGTRVRRSSHLGTHTSYAGITNDGVYLCNIWHISRNDDKPKPSS
jgi:hypothetical protein